MLLEKFWFTPMQLDTSRFTIESWHSVLAQALGLDRPALTELLKSFVARYDRDGPSAPTLKNWEQAKPGSLLSAASATFLLAFLEDAQDRIEESDAELLAAHFLERQSRRRRGAVPETHSDAAAAETMDALWGYILGYKPRAAITPRGCGGFYLMLRRRSYGSSIYQELMYVGETSGSPSFLVAYSGRVLLGRVFFNGPSKAYGIFGAPYHGRGGFSLRMVTLHFPERATNTPAAGMIMRITSSKGISMSSRTACWHLEAAQDSRLAHRLEIILNMMKRQETIPLGTDIGGISDFVTEYDEDHPIYERLKAHLLKPDRLPSFGPLTDDWRGRGIDPSVSDLFAHRYDHGTKLPDR
ncbi:MAG: hypothetical protein R8J41_11095 [Alphaproteobacteria bacterium]|nr:hypothetical protein [Alphaproteobacteria bacterium]